MVNPQNLRRAIALESGIIVTEERVAEILAEIDRTPIEARHKGRIKATKRAGAIINKVDMRNHPRSSTRKRFKALNLQGGKTYKVMIDGKTAIYQWHVPFISGWHPIKSETDHVTGESFPECTCINCVVEYHTDKLVNAYMDDEIAKIVIERVKNEHLQPDV